MNLISLKEKTIEAMEETLHGNPDNKVAYALTYVRAFNHTWNDKEKYVQTLYILSNMTAWRHEDAKRLRELWKKASEELKGK